MATTRIMSLHVSKGKSAGQCIKERLDYIICFCTAKRDDAGNLLLPEVQNQDKNDDLFYVFADKRMPVHKVSRENLSLEEVFLKLTESEEADVVDDTPVDGAEASSDAEEIVEDNDESEVEE